MRSTFSRFITISTLSILVGFMATAILLSLPHTAASQTAGPITGYVWSDTIGWISLSGSGYGLTVATNGTLSGYAWSDNIGWISANSGDLSGCPSGTCAATISGGNLTGWLRALSGESSGAGGWDGWISLSGSGYGVALNETTGNFSGYSWGSTNVGWMDWEYAQSSFTETPPCENTQGNYCQGNQIYSRNAQCATSYVSTCSYECSAGSCGAPPSPGGGLPNGNAIEINPAIVPSGQTTVVEWNVSNVTACTVTGGNGDGPWSGASGSQTTKAITQQTVYTLSCTGLGGNPFTQSATVNIIPVFREI